MLDPRLNGLAALIERASPEELPRLIGDLEAAKAAAWQRMTASIPLRREADWNEQDRNISVAAASDQLAVSKAWIYKNAAKLPFIRRVGHRVVVSVEALHRYMKSGGR